MWHPEIESGSSRFRLDATTRSTNHYTSATLVFGENKVLTILGEIYSYRCIGTSPRMRTCLQRHSKMIYSHEDRSGEEDLSKAGKLQLSAVELSHMVRVPSVRAERGFRVVSRFNRPGGRHHTHIETLYIEISYRGKIGRQD